jgi:hypothetical protein
MLRRKILHVTIAEEKPAQRAKAACRIMESLALEVRSFTIA